MKTIKEKHLAGRLCRILAVVTFVLCVGAATNARAQFHQRNPKGGATQVPAPSGVDMRNWKYGQMEKRDAAVWGRSIFHPNGNYTESKLDEGQRTLQQLTYREKKQDSDKALLLQKRLIKLNVTGRPTEVLIYNSSGQLTNRGTLFYDPLGRMTEERLFDTHNQLVRRKIQTYGNDGMKLPLRTFNYGKSLADDVDLLITSESVQKEAAASKEKKPSFLKKLRWWKKKDKN